MNAEIKERVWERVQAGLAGEPCADDCTCCCCHDLVCACPDDREDNDLFDDGDQDFLFEIARDRKWFE